MVMMFWYYLKAMWPLEENLKISWVPNWQWQVGAEKISTVPMGNDYGDRHTKSVTEGLLQALGHFSELKKYVSFLLFGF